MATVLSAGDSRQWLDIEGRSIDAEYLSHTESSVRIRMDGRIHKIDRARFSAADQEYLNALDVADSQASALVDSKKVVNDGKLLEYHDVEGDISSKRNFPELDITTVRFEKKTSSQIKVTIEFAEALPTRSFRDGEYRIWVRLDLDDDPSTGQVEVEGGLGADIAMTLYGSDANAKWQTYSVPKSNLGHRADVEVHGIEVEGNQLKFTLKGRSIRVGKNYAVSFTSLLGGMGIDYYPDFGAEPIRPWSE